MPTATTATADAVWARAGELYQATDAPAAADELAQLAGGDRDALAEARRRYAVRLHGHADDWVATGALTLLNRAIAQLGWDDTNDWKRRWAKGRKP